MTSTIRSANFTSLAASVAFTAQPRDGICWNIASTYTGYHQHEYLPKLIRGAFHDCNPHVMFKGQSRHDGLAFAKL